jgi:galactoside O-acetyltransferase/maltose O-acetyltransferase
VLNCAAPITFGSSCIVGYYSYIGTAMHNVPEDAHSAVAEAGHTLSPVKIGNGVWIAAHACVLPGVELGEGVVVAAGAVVTASVEPGAVVAGVPARTLRRRCV